MAKLEQGMLDWDDYRPAIERWEGVVGDSPAPVERNTVGGLRLSAAFPEWMMGYEEGWITDLIHDGRTRPPEGFISRTEAMRQIGNSVCQQQAEQAITDLLSA